MILHGTGLVANHGQVLTHVDCAACQLCADGNLSGQEGGLPPPFLESITRLERAGAGPLPDL